MDSESNALKERPSGVAPSRRRFIASALTSALGASIADMVESRGLWAQACTNKPGQPNCSNPKDPFKPVREFRSKNKKLAVDMIVTGGWKSVATIAGQGYQCCPMKLRYYAAQERGTGAKWPENPALPGPGPTLRMRVGDTVDINLVNSIDPTVFPESNSAPNGCNLERDQSGPIYPGSDSMPSCFHQDNVTNLHYHGTHVTPDGNGDNVMVDVKPGDKRPTHFTLPLPPPATNPDTKQPFIMGQAPGTHWYHAHKHGSVALQLLNGMAGAFIIEGEFDDQLEALIPGLATTEKVLVIQQLGGAITIHTDPPPMYTCAGGDPCPLVNGQLQPTIEMRPGEIQRWRFINATMQQASYLTYRFLGEDAYTAFAASNGGPFPADAGNAPVIRQIAYDGIQLAPERYNDPNFGLAQEFAMAPANRIDLLVQAPATPGKSRLAFRYLHGKPPAGCPLLTKVDHLLNLNVSGPPVSPAMNFPTAANYPAMPKWLQWDQNDPMNQNLKSRCLKFNIDNVARPAIDGLAYDHSPHTTQYINLNTAEEWILENYWDSSIHPFHIHVNPFQVLEIFDPNATTQVTLQAPYNWFDTIAIPASKTDLATGIPTPGRVKIRSRFVDFPGTFVLHCHILDHEDRGMMQEVQILDPTKPVPPLAMHS